MTKEEAIAALLNGAVSTNCEYLTVRREHLALALSDETKESDDDVQGHDESPVDDIS